MIPGIDSLIEIGLTAIKRIWPDPEKQAEEERKLLELAQKGDLAKLASSVQLLTGQMEINKVEATHKSIFVAGWRPFVGWTCGFSLAYVCMLEPFMRFVATTIFGYEGEYPVIDTTIMIPVLLGMLGISHHRNEDKKNGTATNSISK